jgi:transposase-like protein
MVRRQRTPNEWFADAARCHVERHQGCAWCGGSYRVHHTRKGSRQEYFCHSCDFHVGYDAATNRYFSYPGEEQLPKKPATMVEL